MKTFNLITAAGAAALSEESEAHISLPLMEIDKTIRELASGPEGVREFICYVPGTWHSQPVLDLCPRPTSLQNRIMHVLYDVGFQVRFDTDKTSYVPRGLADDDGNGPEYINWCIHIKW